MPGQGGGYYDRLQRSEATVRSLEANIDTVKERSRALQAQLNGESQALPPIRAPLEPREQPIDTTIASFERQLTDLLRRYTKHPDVLSTRETWRISTGCGTNKALLTATRAIAAMTAAAPG